MNWRMHKRRKMHIHFLIVMIWYMYVLQSPVKCIKKFRDYFIFEIQRGKRAFFFIRKSVVKGEPKVARAARLRLVKEVPISGSWTIYVLRPNVLGGSILWRIFRRERYHVNILSPISIHDWTERNGYCIFVLH